MKSNRSHKMLTAAAVLLLIWGGLFLYLEQQQPAGDPSQALAAAARYAEDGHFTDALAVYEKLLKAHPDSALALQGEGFVALQMSQQKNLSEEQKRGHLNQALTRFTRAIDIEESRTRASDQSLLGSCFANRGIVNDHLGNHVAALADYRRALAMEPELSEGPGWLVRFLRNRPEVPPTIATRADYLGRQLALPADQQQLSQPGLDSQQYSHKL